MTAWPLYLIGFAAAFASSLLVGLAVCRSAARSGFLDPPGGRKTQKGPVPLGGGLAVIGSFAATVLAGTIFLWAAPASLPVESPLGSLASEVRVSRPVLLQLGAVLVGASAALFTGLLDDRRKRTGSFPTWAKLLGQSVAALPAIATGIRVTFLPGDVLDVAATFLWIVLITNAFNFLDNMDGLSAGVAAIATGIFAATALAQGQLLIGGCLVALLGSLCGFLPLNFFPARLYLGDAGSLAVGNVLATLTVLESYVARESQTLLPILFPLLVLAVPLVDTGVAVVSRIRERRPIHVADLGHVSHRLVARGLTRRQAVVVLWLFTVCFGLCASLLPGASLTQGWLLLALALAIAGILLALLVVFPLRASPP